MSIILSITHKWKSLLARLQLSQFSKHGKNVHIGHDCEFVPSHIECGDNVYIGNRASFIATVSHIHIGSYVMFGPNVTIRGGDHRMDVIGKHIYEIREDEKVSENDQDVYIEDGVWVGCNATILKGVTVGRGAVIAAGSVVVDNVPPYAIVAGVKARIIKYRFTPEQIVEHERILSERGLM